MYFPLSLMISYKVIILGFGELLKEFSGRTYGI